MPNYPNRYGMIRRFLSLIQRVLRLVLIAIELIEGVPGLFG